MHFKLSFDILRWLIGFKAGRTAPSQVQGIFLESAIPTTYYLILYVGPLSLRIAVRGPYPKDTE